MTGDHPLTDRWFRLLLRCYPADFREEAGDDLIATYKDRAREALVRGRLALAGVWLSAFRDSIRNGLGERWHPAVVWRRRGVTGDATSNWPADGCVIARCSCLVQLRR
jgi:hypothetical protein